ncbi:hypothetical protein B0H14DRAFT_2614657 [Mycena olivaceomarginata]|nr:hypothetical protein B0H14DRAFT_2614657 [Mycena olivaceomarginata]
MADLAGYPGYLLTATHESEQETRRLDEMHAAFTRYFGGELGPSPIAEVHPRKILDLGCVSIPKNSGSSCQERKTVGHGHALNAIPQRAIQAAIQFLEAEVIAVDIYRRFRTTQLVKPGGLLVMEDIDVNFLVQTGGPATRLLASKAIEIWESRSADTDISRKYAGIMTSMGYFPRIHVHKISMPLGGTGSDEATNELGLAIKKSWTQLSESLGSRFVAEGLAEAMIQEQREELYGKDCKATTDILNRILYIFGHLVPAEDERTEGTQRFKGR